jgi:hypothetical protein
MPETRAWTVIAYIIGDDANTPATELKRLDEAAHAEAVKMIRSASVVRDMHLAVHVDLTETPGCLRSIGTNKLERFDEEAKAGLKGLMEFIKEVGTACPAKYYMLLLWGHGGGPLGMFSDQNGPNGPMKVAGTLSLKDLAKVLNQTCYCCHREGSGAIDKVDIVLVKSCYMATVEAAWEIVDRTNFLICSQAVVPARTWQIWDVVFRTLMDDSPEEVAKQLLIALGHHYDEAVERERRKEVPFSLLRTAAIRDLRNDFKKLVARLQLLGGNHTLAAAFEGARPRRAGDKALLDLGTLCASIAHGPIDDSDLKAFAEKVSRRLANEIIQSHIPADSAFSGLGIFHFPPDPLKRVMSFANDVALGSYSELQFCQDTKWHEIAFTGVVPVQRGTKRQTQEGGEDGGPTEEFYRRR